jgi:hypothetical protein
VAPLPALDVTNVDALNATPVGAVVSIVTASGDDAADTLPAASTAFAVNVWLPSASVPAVIDQVPPVAVAVPSTVVPFVSYKVTVLPLSAVPVMTGVAFAVMSSVFDEPLSLALPRSGVDGAFGAVWSSVYVAPAV